EYDVLRNATVAQLHQALQHDYHVLHYVGHGTSGQLVLTDDAGDPYVMDDQEFAQLVQGRGTLRLVFLNACHSSQADGAGLYTGVGPSLIKAGVPAVVAMQYPAVQLTTASVFSAATYGALANGRPIDTAVNEGRKLLSAGQMLGARDWSTPVLYTGTRTGRILHLPEAENEEVEADWASVQRAARQSGAMAAFAGLSQRFQEVASRVSVLKTLTALSRLLAALRADFAPCVALVDGARGLAANIPLEQLTSAWRAVNQGGLNDLQMFITEHPATAGAQWYVDLMSSKQRINGDLADIAMVPLQNDVVAFSGRIAAAEAHVSQETARALDSFISYSDRTLGLLSVK
ncbi:MAG TPA: CHAT domain-containing protein, partial [Pyrinomonadaceae bacterium]